MERTENDDHNREGAELPAPICWSPFTPPFRFDPTGTMIFDSENRVVLEVRGWGYLTGSGGLGLTDLEADKIEIEFGKRVAAAMNHFSNVKVRDAAKNTEIENL
jgi:hypothetical protein